MKTPEFEIYVAAQKAVQFGLHDVADKIAQTVKAGVWKGYELPNKEMVEHERFVDFVTTAPPRGLGTDIETVRRVCRDTPYALDMIDRVLQEDQRPGERTDLRLNRTEVDEPPRSTGSRSYALRRLRKDAPELHEQVIAGEMSPHAAMVKAGLRRQTITVPLEPEKIVAALRRHLDADGFAAVIFLALGMSSVPTAGNGAA